MGRGDKRTRRGKIWRGTYGKTRPNPKKVKRAKKQKLMEEGKKSGSSKKSDSKS